MRTSRRLLKYAKAHFNEVVHTTLNPEGPGVIRIHMIPPTYDQKGVSNSIVILNGMDIIPVNSSWSVLLYELINQINVYEGHEVTDEQVEDIIEKTCKNVKKVYPFIQKRRLQSDIYTIMNTFKQVAYGQKVTEEINYMTLGEYSPLMKAPHRMDLMVSAMVKDGYWHCNQKCIHCYAADQIHSEEEELSTEEWFEVIDRCREIGIPQLTFTGGEPTMRDDLVELVDHARWFVTRLNTNGIRLTEELCNDLKEASLDSMQITFYSVDPRIHNVLVGANQYRNTVQGIKNALNANLNISINTPLCTLNRDYLRTLKFLNELGVTYVTCSGLITTGNATTTQSEKMQLTEWELRDILKEATEYCFENGMEISFTSPGWIDDQFFESIGITSPTCGACLSNMAITPSGFVVPCQSWLDEDALGHILDDPWEKIWTSEKCLERRNYSSNVVGKCPLRIHRYKEDEE